MYEIIEGAERAVADTETITGPDLTTDQLDRLMHGDGALERAPQPLIVIDRQGAPDWEAFPGAVFRDEAADYYQPGAPVDPRTVEAITQLLERIEHMAHGLNVQPGAAPVAAPQTMTVTATSTAPLDFAGRHPVAMAPLRRPIVVRHWGARLAYSGVAALLAGAADGVVAGTAVASVAACAAGLAAIVGGVARSELEQNRENPS